MSINSWSSQRNYRVESRLARTEKRLLITSGIWRTLLASILLILPACNSGDVSFNESASQDLAAESSLTEKSDKPVDLEEDEPSAPHESAVHSETTISQAKETVAETYKKPASDDVVSFDPLPAEKGERVSFLRDEISETVDQVVADFPGEANPLSLRALVHSRFNRPDLAKEVWLTCLELDPEFVSAHTALGTIALENSDLDEAERYLRQAIEHRADHEQARTSLAECLIKQNRPKEAIELLQPDSSATSIPLIDLYHLGQAHSQLKEFDAAIDYFQRAINISPELTYAHYGLGTAYRRVGKSEEAKAALKKFQQLKQADLKSQKELAKGADDESGLRKTAAHVHFIAGDVYSKASDLATAVAHWIRSAKLDPQEVRARENLAQVFMQTGNLPQTVVILNELRRIERTNPTHLMNLGMIQARLGQTEPALQSFMEAIEISPDSSDAMMATAEFLIMHRRDPDKARMLAEQGTRLAESARNFRILALACVFQEDFESARGAVNNGLRLEPTDPELKNLKFQLESKLANDNQPN